MSTSPERLAANRANAQHSTGPVSPQGKAASSQNALKHGLTGDVAVLPAEDQNQFQRFCGEMIASLEPVTPAEREFAQIVAHTQWRLRRVKSIEDGLLGHGQFGPTDPFSEPACFDDSEVLARSFMDNGKSFSNLSHYENRLYRNMTHALKQLQTLQAARDHHAGAIESAARDLFNFWRYTNPFPEAPPAPERTAQPAVANEPPAEHIAEPLTESLDWVTEDVEDPPRESPAKGTHQPLNGFVFPETEIGPSEPAPSGLWESIPNEIPASEEAS